jgi:hypothetical protein
MVKIWIALTTTPAKTARKTLASVVFRESVFAVDSPSHAKRMNKGTAKSRKM